MCYPGRREFSFSSPFGSSHGAIPVPPLANGLLRLLHDNNYHNHHAATAIISHLTVFTIIFRLKKGSFVGYSVLLFVIPVPRQTILLSKQKTDLRATKSGVKVLIITFHQLHSEHSVFTVQRSTSEKFSLERAIVVPFNGLSSSSKGK